MGVSGLSCTLLKSRVWFVCVWCAVCVCAVCVCVGGVCVGVCVLVCLCMVKSLSWWVDEVTCVDSVLCVCHCLCYFNLNAYSLFLVSPCVRIDLIDLLMLPFVTF